MVYPVYSNRDNKVGFGAPYIELNDQTAIRGFGLKINNADVMAFAPADFDLYKIGEFDTESGSFTSCVPKLVVSGTSVFRSET